MWWRRFIFDGETRIRVSIGALMNRLKQICGFCNPCCLRWTSWKSVLTLLIFVCAVQLFIPALASAQTSAELMKLLKSPKAPARKLAAEALGKQKVMTAIPDLAESLKDDEEMVRDAAAGALAQMGTKAVAYLAMALKYPRDESKLAALKALRRLGPEAKSVLPNIVQALSDKSVDVRIHAAAALGSMNGAAKSALPNLFASAKDTGNLGNLIRAGLPCSVTEAAIAAALEIDNKCGPELAKVAIKDLTAALQSKNDAVVLAAANALVKLGPNAKAALPALEKAYKRSGGLAETVISQAILAAGGEGTSVLSEISADAKAPREKRLKAMYQLGLSVNPDERVVAALAGRLKDPDPQLRAGAVMALAMLGPAAKGAIPPLIDLLADDKLDEAADKVIPGTSKVVPQAITRVGAEAVPALTEVLKDGTKTPYARWQAAGTLSNLGRGAKSSLATLEATMKDKDPLVASESACAYVLAGGDSTKAVTVLAGELKDKSPKVLTAAADAIRRLGPKVKDTVPSLTALLTNENREVRLAAAHALSTMGADAKPAVPALANLLKQEDPQQRIQVILALGRLGPNAQDVLPALVERLKDMQPISHHPLLAVVADFGPDAKDAVPALIELLKKKEVIFHNDAMLALGQIGPSAEAAVPQLEAFLSNASEYPRASAARALGGIGPKAKSAVPALRKLAENDKPAVRVWANFALARITSDVKPPVDALIELWKAYPDDENSLADSVRSSIAQAFELLGADALPARDLLLGELLDEKTPAGTRMATARALGRFIDDADVLVPRLLELANRKAEFNGHVYNCVLACQSLGMLGSSAKAALPQLQKMTQDDNDEIASAASWAASRVESKKQ
jgi:HEAT repeat protein